MAVRVTNLEDYDEVLPFRYSITSYGADYPVDALVKRMRDGTLYVPPFQRGFVWSITVASRFIESLLLGLPVPGIFLSKEPDSQRLLVIDGQQRLRTLQYFYDGIFGDTGREFALVGVQEQFRGLTYKSLADDDRRRLDDSILHATIVKQDEPSDDQSSIYHIFERINTGGIQLTPQEIRACIYHGPFQALLQNLNRVGSWRSVYGPEDSRMRDQELILRFLALYFWGQNYSKPMKGFLNAYMGRNRELRLTSEEEIRRAFEPTIELISQAIGKAAFKPRRALNAAVFDAVMIGIARRLEKGPVYDLEGVRQAYARLVEDETFRKATETGTSHEESVHQRIALATHAFSGIR